MKKGLILVVLFILLGSVSEAQETEVLIHLNERFFNDLLDFAFREEIEFSISRQDASAKSSPGESCKETIKIRRQLGQKRSKVQFREGKITAFIAFTGSYKIPLVECVDFSGVAEAEVNLEYKADDRVLLAHVKVLSVNISGTGGIGGSLIAKMIQGSIDKRVNPIEVISLDKLSFSFSIKEREIRMHAVGMRYEVMDGGINVFARYAFR